MPIDVEYGKYISPSEYDILLTDITKADVMDVSRDLGISHLAKIDGQSNFPINGIFKGKGNQQVLVFQYAAQCVDTTLYDVGDNNRMFACLTVKKRGSARNVCCLYDTGSPYTYLSEETLALLGYSESVPEQAEVNIHGVSLPVHVSHAHFKDINLLGQNFLEKVRASVSISYFHRIFSIKA